MVISCTFHLYDSGSIPDWYVDLNLTPRVFLQALQFSSLCKFDFLAKIWAIEQLNISLCLGRMGNHLKWDDHFSVILSYERSIVILFDNLFDNNNDIKININIIIITNGHLIEKFLVRTIHRSGVWDSCGMTEKAFENSHDELQLLTANTKDPWYPWVSKNILKQNAGHVGSGLYPFKLP